MEAYSILMSVYHKENPEFFAQALQSMMDQTVMTNDFVLVCDGPLTDALDAVIESFEKRYPGIFQVVRLEKNVGIGAAANIGLGYCKNELVAKMDADDISVIDRCECQLKKFQENPELTVLGGYIDEFDVNPETPFACRQVPCEHKQIYKFARRRQPFNNMTVMYRRSAVLAVDGYHSLRRCEDYDLYVRLLSAGYYTENLPKVLVKARVGQGGISRRASKDTLQGIITSRRNAVRMGFSSWLDFAICVGGELVFMICPDGLKRFIYNRFLRKKS